MIAAAPSPNVSSWIEAPARPMPNPREALNAANAYLEAGLSVIPIARDGTKKPPTGWRWKEFQTRRLSPREAQDIWDVDNPPGIGVIAGGVSGGLECIDFDADSERIYPAFRELVDAAAPGLFDRLTVSRTPKGYHVRYRCDTPIPGNTNLAL